MRPTFRKLEVKDINSLERLVAENVDGVEPGLKVVDSRLLLGQAAIDLVGLDGKGSLVLIALDFSPDDGLLLRVMDAYSWCLEYPDALRRLYPMAQESSRPPRILFIVEKMTDAFLRRVKQLSFLEIDCFEFRHLEVNGASVVYFDLVERLRKSVVESTEDVRAPSPLASASAVERRVEPHAEPRVEPRAASRVEPRVEPRVESRLEPVKPAIERLTQLESRESLSEPKRVDPPKVLAAEPIRFEPAVAVVAAPEPAAPVAASPSAPAPVVEEPRAVVEVQAAPVVEYQSVKLEAAVAMAPDSAPAAVMPAEPALALESIEWTSRPHTNGHAPASVAPVVEATPNMPAPIEEPVAAPAVAEVAPFAAAATAAVAPVPAPAPIVPAEPAPAPVQAPPVWAKPGSQPNAPRPNFFASATKSTTPIEAPVMVATVASTAEPATQPAASKVGLEVDDRPELESLSFPKDGLSRQWLEFLSQLGATK